MSLSHHPNIVRNGLVAYFDAANPKSYPAGQDPYVNNVSLMLDGESLVDQSANARTFTASVGASVSTANKKFGNSSIYCTGSTSYIYNSSFNSSFGGDFTIEFWAYHNSFSSVNILIHIGNESSGRHSMFINSSGKVQVDLYFTGVIGTFNTTISTGAWNHYVLTRSGTTVKLFVNGTLDSTTISVSGTFGNANGVYIGAASTAVNGSNAYFDDIRITSGISRYAASFTPPAAPLSLPGRITDLTTNKVIGTLTNGPTYSAGAITTDGVNDYINCGNYANANFGTSNFTINMWIKTTSTAGGTILAKSTGDSANASYGWLVYLNATSSGEIGFATATAAGAFSASGNYIIRTSGASVNNGTWKMITVVADRTLANVSIYINGALQTLTTWLTATASLATVGNITNSQILCIGNESDFNVPANAAFSAVQLYNKALTVSEVLQNYNAIKSRYG